MDKLEDVKKKNDLKINVRMIFFKGKKKKRIVVLKKWLSGRVILSSKKYFR